VNTVYNIDMEKTWYALRQKLLLDKKQPETHSHGIEEMEAEAGQPCFHITLEHELPEPIRADMQKNPTKYSLRAQFEAMCGKKRTALNAGLPADEAQQKGDSHKEEESELYWLANFCDDADFPDSEDDESNEDSSATAQWLLSTA